MIYLLFTPAVLSFLLLVAAYRGFFGLSVDPKVHPNDLVSTFTTIFLALILQQYVAKQTKRTDFEKTLLLTHVGDVIEAIRSVRQPLRAATQQKILMAETASEIVSAFESCTEELATLELMVDSSHCRGLLDEVKQVTEVLLRYKTSVTGMNFPAMAFTLADISKSSAFQRRLANSLQVLMLSINAQ